MKFLLLATMLAGCGIDASNTCIDSACACPSSDSCDHACTSGVPECNIDGAFGQPVMATCDHNSTCEVECGMSSSCTVDCGGSAICRVTCPKEGCTVENCDDASCSVSCFGGHPATTTNTTTTCPS